ncbi:MAG: 23S rRNA (guanosine(2251)-2'-O)-methyltransferase RlmB [Pseudomonadota bacterium]
MAARQHSAGVHAIDILLRVHANKVRKLLIDSRSTNPRVEALAQRARELGIAVQPLRSHKLDDLARGTAHQGVVAELHGVAPLDEAALRQRVEAALVAGEVPLMLVLDGVQDPHNLGACLRSAEAAGAMAVITPRKSSASLTPAARKVASGAAESVPVVQVPALAHTLDWLGEYGIQRTATSDAAQQTLWEADLVAPQAMVMGTESKGLAREVIERCDALVALPMQGNVESLNVSVAAGICLFEAVRQRSACQSPTT